ncbi:RCC1 domain-containing protein [Arthrobacter bambusae]
MPRDAWDRLYGRVYVGVPPVSGFKFFRSAVISAFVVLLLIAGAIPANAAIADSLTAAARNPSRAPATNTAREVQPSVTTSAAFSDVPGGAPFFTEISWLSGQGISTGWVQPDGSRIYGPLLPVARDAMAAFMYRLAGSPDYTAPAASPFTDVPPGTPFYKEITWLASQGISTGWTEPDGSKTYRPLNSVNRDAMAAFMYRFGGSPAYTPQAISFADVGADNHFYSQITWLASQGISTGWTGPDGTKTYRPLGAVNRDAMAAFMYRFYRVTHPLTISDGALHDGLAGARYLDQVSAAGGIAPLTWTATGLPIGITVSPDGAVSGIPTATGTAAASFTVTDAAGSTAAVTRTINIPTSMPAGCIGQACAILTPATSTVHVPAAAISGVTRDAATQKIATVTLTGPGVSGVTIATGQILVLAPAPGIDSGAIGAVTGVTTNPEGTVTAALSPRTPEDAYTDGTVNAIDPTMPTTGADASPVSYRAETGKMMASTALYRPGAAPVQIPASAVKTTCQGSAQITLTGLALTSTLTPSMAAKWSLLGLDRFQFDLDGAININTGASLSGQGSCTVTFPQAHAIVPAGELGVIVFNVQPVLKFSASGKVDVSGSVKLGCGSEYLWQGGTSRTIQHCGDTVTPIGFTSATGATANATGTINVGMALDDMIGVTGTLTGALDANYTPLSHPMLTLDGTVGYELGGCLACFWPNGPHVTIASGTFYHHRLWKLDTPPTPATTTPTGPLAIITTTLPAGTVGNAYRTYLTATGGTGPYTWNTTGTLPAGLHLEPTTGAITGTPTNPGTTNLTVTTTDVNNTTATITTTLTTQPAAPSGLTGVKTIVGSATSEETNYAVLKDGTVRAWGVGYPGQLGNGSTTNSSTPVQVQGLTGVTSVTASGATAYALLADGTVRAWGYNGYGELGNGTTTDSSTPVQIQGLSGVISITATYRTAYALLKDGTVRAWGYNYSGQLGNGTTTDSTTPVQVTGLTGAASVTIGYDATYALLADGTVRAWGANGYGQLGNGTTTNSSSPVQVTGLTGVTSVTANDGTAYALLADGTVRAWGDGRARQLGNGTTTKSSTPVQVQGLTGVTSVTASGATAYAVLKDGTVRAWGSNGIGELGNGTTTNSGTPVQVQGLTGVVSITAAGGTAYAVLADGTVRAWGYNYSGQLGNGTTTNSTTPVQVQGLTAASITANGNNACALLADGTVRAWGYNGYGELGNGTTTNSSTPVQVTS